MLGKLRPRSAYDVMAALALFLVLAGGVAYAANTVFSSDIVDGEVKEADIATSAVREAEIGQGAVATAELKNDAVTSAKVLNETLVGGDVKDNALKGADIDESTLSSIGGGGPLGADRLIFLRPGPLPVEGIYTSEGGTLMIFASGSGFRGTGSSLKEGLIGMEVRVDGTLAGLAAAYTNERNSHKAFSSDYPVVRNLPAGPHTIRLEEAVDPNCNTAAEVQRDFCTDTDGNDTFQLTVLEIPDS